MRDLVGDLINAKISRRGFLAGMSAASFSAAAAESAFQSVVALVPLGQSMSRFDANYR